MKVNSRVPGCNDEVTHQTAPTLVSNQDEIGELAERSPPSREVSVIYMSLFERVDEMAERFRRPVSCFGRSWDLDFIGTVPG